jgi:Flp pilus assembly protein TadG
MTAFFARFRRDRRGSAAVEFAMIAPIFFGIFFAIIEVAMVFFAGQILETGAQDAARLIMTGQAQNGGMSQAQFKQQVCDRISAMFDCSGVYVDVKSYSQFSSATIVTPIDANKNFVTTMNYQPGNAGDIVVVRVFYQWPLYLTSLGFDLSNLSGGKRLLAATASFRNEPF